MSPGYHNDAAPKCALHIPDDWARQRKGLVRGRMCILGHLSSNWCRFQGSGREIWQTIDGCGSIKIVPSNRTGNWWTKNRERVGGSRKDEGRKPKKGRLLGAFFCAIHNYPCIPACCEQVFTDSFIFLRRKSIQSSSDLPVIVRHGPWRGYHPHLTPLPSRERSLQFQTPYQSRLPQIRHYVPRIPVMYHFEVRNDIT